MFSDVWSENTALFERLMEIHSNPPILHVALKSFLLCTCFNTMYVAVSIDMYLHVYGCGRCGMLCIMGIIHSYFKTTFILFMIIEFYLSLIIYFWDKDRK